MHAPLCTSLRQDTEPVKISLDLRGMRRDIPGCTVQGLQNLVSKVNQSRQASQELRISEGDSDGIDSTDVLRTRYGDCTGTVYSTPYKGWQRVLEELPARQRQACRVRWSCHSVRQLASYDRVPVHRGTSISMTDINQYVTVSCTRKQQPASY
jgi:hypothetical protein